MALAVSDLELLRSDAWSVVGAIAAACVLAMGPRGGPIWWTLIGWSVLVYRLHVVMEPADRAMMFVVLGLVCFGRTRRPWTAYACFGLALLTGFTPLGEVSRAIDLRGWRRGESFTVRGYDLSRADARGADLRGLAFERCNLRGARFDQAVLRGVKFTSGNLEGATFHGTDLRRAQFLGNIRELSFSGQTPSVTEGVVLPESLGAENRWPCACSQAKLKRRDPAELRYRETVVIPGDPERGTVIYLPQTHYVPSDSIYSSAETGYSQLALLDYLTERHLDVVFQEGRIRDLQADGGDGWRPMESDTRVTWLVNTPRSPRRRVLAALFGAPVLHAAISATAERPITILATDTLEFQRYWVRETDYFESGYDSSCRPLTNAEAKRQYDKLVFDAREAFAAKKIEAYLDSHRGATVGLVFGASHVFDADDFSKRSRLPRLIRVDVASPTDTRWALKKTASPEEQLEILERTGFLLPDSFAGLDVTLMAAALPLVIAPEDVVQRPEQLRTELERSIEEATPSATCDPRPARREARRSLARLFRDGKGPFTGRQFERIEKPAHLNTADLRELPGWVQLDLVNAAATIEGEAFRVLQAYEAQREALPKLRFQRPFDESLPLTNALTDLSVSQPLRTALEWRHEAWLAPFPLNARSRTNLIWAKGLPLTTAAPPRLCAGASHARAK